MLMPLLKIYLILVLVLVAAADGAISGTPAAPRRLLSIEWVLAGWSAKQLFVVMLSSRTAIGTNEMQAAAKWLARCIMRLEGAAAASQTKLDPLCIH